jgi:hypothetical protein
VAAFADALDDEVFTAVLSDEGFDEDGLDEDDLDDDALDDDALDNVLRAICLQSC